MAKIKLEYIWLDGYEPVANIRGKTKIEDGDPEKFTLEDCPMWGFDGSSTQQAEGDSSDCMLKPVALYPDITRKNAFIVMSEVMMPDGTPHPSNARATIIDDDHFWVGLEQEYFMMREGAPLGWPSYDGFPGPQGPYYTGVGYKNVGRYRPPDRRRTPRHLPRGRHQPRRHQRRGGQGSVGIPNLR